MTTELVYGLWWLGCGLITCASIAVIFARPGSPWPLAAGAVGAVAGLSGAALGVAWGVA